MRENLIRDINLAPSGHKKIDWVKGYMPVLSFIEKKFTEEQPLKGKKITMSIHLEAKTAYLAKVLKAGGADVTVTGSNPLSTQDDVASALAEDGLKVYAWYNSTSEEYNNHLNSALDIEPNIILDDGGDLVNLLHTTRQELIKNIIGGSEETTTGVLRLKAREREGKLKFPMISANGAYCKYLFDNRYGTGQSVWDGIMRTTNLIVAGKNVVVIGYGWCGKGVAMRAKGLGAKVIICEINPIKAIEAHMDGFKVMPSLEAAKIGDIFITVTGDMKVLSKEHYKLMKNGAIMANAGHFDCEVWKPDLEEMSIEKREMRKNITGYVMPDKKILNLLAEGRLVNLAAGDGHPAEIMDMSFSIQALSIKYLINNAGKLENKVYDVPDEIDKEVATTKLKSMGIEIDRLTEEQEKYLKSW
ncbi:adenosylhomocysteinase [Acidilutibacter cellobiosedens]|jgi:adenosylhomocysteinase|uniref:Adenosylhomocysteinase n=1 Tax=Acidilutibacter cellobiosedens TaxID=2507161 RepID=A0A410QEP9_9FIRM|nr:adenosylhomocysteinase [Acidilutibacter cellobiosedens]QAT62308.1 adenosylhomocysteinase [Acidilutibacter cellobiosedens]